MWYVYFLASRKFLDYSRASFRVGGEEIFEHIPGRACLACASDARNKKECGGEYPKTIHFTTTEREPFPIRDT